MKLLADSSSWSNELSPFIYRYSHIGVSLLYKYLATVLSHLRTSATKEEAFLSPENGVCQVGCVGPCGRAVAFGAVTYSVG